MTSHTPPVTTKCCTLWGLWIPYPFATTALNTRRAHVRHVLDMSTLSSTSYARLKHRSRTSPTRLVPVTMAHAHAKTVWRLHAHIQKAWPACTPTHPRSHTSSHT